MGAYMGYSDDTRDVQFRRLKGYPNWSQLHDYHISAYTAFSPESQL